MLTVSPSPQKPLAISVGNPRIPPVETLKHATQFDSLILAGLLALASVVAFLARYIFSKLDECERDRIQLREVIIVEVRESLEKLTNALLKK